MSTCSALKSSATFRAAALLARACSLARASSALRASTAEAPHASTSHHINITTFLQFPKIDVDIGNHTLRLLESLVNKRDVSLHNVNLSPQFGTFSGLVYCRTLSNLHINTSAIIIWEYVPPFAAIGWHP